MEFLWIFLFVCAEALCQMWGTTDSSSAELPAQSRDRPVRRFGGCFSLFFLVYFFFISNFLVRGFLWCFFLYLLNSSPALVFETLCRLWERRPQCCHPIPAPRLWQRQRADRWIINPAQSCSSRAAGSRGPKPAGALGSPQPGRCGLVSRGLRAGQGRKQQAV